MRFILENTNSGAKYSEADTLVEAIAKVRKLCCKQTPGGIAIWERPENVKVAEINHQGELWVTEKYRAECIKTSQLRREH